MISLNNYNSDFSLSNHMRLYILKHFITCNDGLTSTFMMGETELARAEYDFSSVYQDHNFITFSLTLEAFKFHIYLKQRGAVNTCVSQIRQSTLRDAYPHGISCLDSHHLMRLVTTTPWHNMTLTLLRVTKHLFVVRLITSQS